MESHKQLLISKYRVWYKDVPEDWKIEVIAKAANEGYEVDTDEDIDYLYDDAIDHLTGRTMTKLTNLAKKLGHKQMPCHRCRMMLKFWNYNPAIGKWTPEVAHLFPK